MTVPYTNLHVHSEYSLLDGAAKVKRLAQTAKAAGHTHLALTDHGSMSGALEHKRACEKEGIQPIYGCELFLIEHFDDLEKTKQHNLHLTTLAKDQQGFEMLLRGLGHAHTKGLGKSGKQRRPFLPITYALENGWKDHVVILSGCFSSPFWNLKDSDGLELFQKYAEYFGPDFYGEVMPLHDWDEQNAINDTAIEAAKAMGRKTVVTNDIHYCKAEESDLHELVICMSQHGMTWNNPKRWKFSTHQNFVRTAEDMQASLAKMGIDNKQSREFLLNTQEIAEKCSFKLAKYGLDLPNPLPEGVDEVEYFAEQCYEGMKRRGCDNDAYWNRLEYESKILNDKGFIRYMLIVADVIQWAKGHGVFVGPARGSSGGSLVSYVLGITEIDPIFHGLQFERFVAPDRIDLPDVDIDVEDNKRYMVELYLREKYGDDNVAHLSTFTAMRGKAALRDTARVFELPLDEVNAVSPLILHKAENDAREFNTIEDTMEADQQFKTFADQYPDIIKHAMNLEGQIRNMGVHAAGYVLSKNSLKDSAKCYMLKGESELMAVNWDKDDLEFFGLVKIDLLGLSTASAISGALELIKQRTGKELKLNLLPLDDPETFKAIGRGETAAVFQLMTPGLTRYCRDMKPEHFEDIAAATALCRPGPAQAGMATDYVEVRWNRKEPVYFCPEYKEIVEKTRGQLIYQEQLTDLLIKIANFTYTDADKVRKIIGKKLGSEEWQKYKQRFIDGCVKKGTLDADGADNLWDKLAGFAGYAFNKSHAVAYGLISYWTAWLKTHYPAEFLCAYLNYGSTKKENKDGDKNIDIALKEAMRMGLKILPPSVIRSKDDWSVEGERGLRAGLREVRNVGPAAKAELARVLSLRSYQTVEDFLNNVNRRAMNIRVLKSLMFAGAFDDMTDVERWRKEWVINVDERPSFLNYDENALKRIRMAMDQIAQLVGGNVIEKDGLLYIVKDGHEWSTEQALTCNMPGLKAEVVNGIPMSKEVKDLQKSTKTCKECELHKSCKAPVPVAIGNLNVMIIAESPGQGEDIKGKPLIGRAGQFLWAKLDKLGLEREMFYLDNTVHCRPPLNKTQFEHVDACPHLAKSLGIVKPKVVLALGNKALYFFKEQESGIKNLSGTTEWDINYQCWITYCVHPSSAMREENGKEMMPPFNKGLKEFQRVLGCLV